MACQAVKLDGSVFKAYNKEPNPLRPISDKVSGANFQQVDQFKMVDMKCNNPPDFVIELFQYLQKTFTVLLSSRKWEAMWLSRAYLAVCFGTLRISMNYHI